MTKIKVLIGAGLLVALAALRLVNHNYKNQSSLQITMAPHFLVDPLWPKPLPNHWVQGNTIGVDVDERDHIFAVHRNTESQFAKLKSTLFRCF